MSEFHSPVPLPALDAVAPEVCREIYGMPMFPIAPTRDLAASRDFWTRGLGFVDLFSIPDRLTHLRRWAFQDVLLRTADDVPGAPGMAISFACVPGQIDEIVANCEKLVPGCTSGPREMPWNSIEVEVVTPENTRVVMTAARPIDPDGPQAEGLRAVGIEVPRA